MRICLAFMFGIAVLSVGCGDSLAPVAGEVTWKGEPCNEGYVIFYPADGKSVPETFPLENGRYGGRCKPGPKIVHLYATKEIPPAKGVPDVMNQRQKLQLFDATYNAESKIKVDVVNGPNTIDFHFPEKK